MILLDTHVLLWLDAGDRRLGPESRAAIDQALREDRLACSAISFWEVAMLVQRGRVTVRQPLAAWRDDLLASGLLEIPVDGAIGMYAVALESFPADPADRMIAATAHHHSYTLLTADQRILSSDLAVKTLDARA